MAELERDDGDQEVRELLERAGPRPEVPPEELAVIKAAFRAAWEEQVRPPRRLRPLWLAGLAAALLLALTGIWWWQGQSAPESVAIVARVERVGGAGTLKPGDELPAGATVEARGGHLALRLAAGQALRVERGSRVQLEGGGRLRLDEGALYVDSEGAVAEPVRVATSLGSAREVGTRFEVRLSAAEGLRVRVREGAVEVARGGAEHRLEQGQALVVGHDGRVQRDEAPAYGASWAWVLEAAPPLRAGRPLAEILTDVARETGWTLRYADRATEAAARTIRVEGALAHLHPDEVPEVVLAGTSLRYRVEDGALVVERVP